MVFAPVADELPDARVTPRQTPVDGSVEPLVSSLVERIRDEPDISEDFKRLWLRYVGA